MLHAVNLTKKYQENLALDNLNLVIEPGDIYCLLGANGAGKSTTINLFLNFIAPTSGKAVIDQIEDPPLVRNSPTRLADTSCLPSQQSILDFLNRSTRYTAPNSLVYKQ